MKHPAHLPDSSTNRQPEDLPPSPTQSFPMMNQVVPPCSCSNKTDGMSASNLVDSQRNPRRHCLCNSLAPASSPTAALLGEYVPVYAQVQLVSGEPLKGVRRADVARQPDITDAVTSGANGPRPSDCNARSDTPAQARTRAVIQACITPMYRRYGPGIIITITVAPHHAFAIKRIHVGDLSWRCLSW